MRSRKCPLAFMHPTLVTSKAPLFDLGSLRRKHRGPVRGIGLVWLLRERAWMLNCNHVNFINFKLIIWEGIWHQDKAKEKYPYTTPINTCWVFFFWLLYSVLKKFWSSWDNKTGWSRDGRADTWILLLPLALPWKLVLSTNLSRLSFLSPIRN